MFTDFDRAVLDKVLRLVQRGHAEGERIMGVLDDLKAAEDAEGQAVAAILAFVQTLTAQVTDLQAQLTAAGGDPAAAAAVLAEIQAHTAALQAAVPGATPPA